MRTYNFVLTDAGGPGLLMHWDNIDWADQMEAWKNKAANKKASKAGDDRTPAWRWIGSTYQDGEHVVMPAENVMRCLMEAGARVPVPGGKNGVTFKSQSQSGIVPGDMNFIFKVNGKQISWASIDSLLQKEDFKEHLEIVKSLGFDLLVKRATIGKAKHIRVRPQFRNWSIEGQLTVTDPQITTDILREIFQVAGTYKGLGDWRPGAKTPGSYGRFTAEILEA